jgi:hypothetical protein
MDHFSSMSTFLISINTNVFYSEELFSIIMAYNFFKLTSMSSLMELLWPTHFFNRKNTILFRFCRKRAFLEFLLYAFRPFIKNILINRFFVKHVFVRK